MKYRAGVQDLMDDGTRHRNEKMEIEHALSMGESLEQICLRLGIKSHKHWLDAERVRVKRAAARAEK